MAAKVAALERFRDAQEEVEQELAAARKMVRVVCGVPGPPSRDFKL